MPQHAWFNTTLTSMSHYPPKRILSVFCLVKDQQYMVGVMTLPVTTSDRSGKMIWQADVPFLRGPMMSLPNKRKMNLPLETRCLLEKSPDGL
jgi:hypothetical protein